MIVSIPIVTHPVPPLSDYVNHLSRMHIIAQLKNDPELSRYYTIEWSVLPNLMMDLIVPLLDRFTSVFVAGEIYTLLCFALIAFGTLALHRALFGQWSAIPLLAFPLLYNSVFLIGVMNYVFGNRPGPAGPDLLGDAAPVPVALSGRGGVRRLLVLLPPGVGGHLRHGPAGL